MKLDLKKDRQKIQSYIERRIEDYPVYENLGPGDDDAPITLVTLSFDGEEDSCVMLVFDTRPDADVVDGRWKQYLDNDTNFCSFPKWKQAYESLWADHTVILTRPDGTKVNLGCDDADEGFQNDIGRMLADVLDELRDNGTMKKLPLAPDAFMVVEEWGGRFYWPTYKTRRTVGSILKPAGEQAASRSGRKAKTRTGIDLRKDRSKIRKYIEKRIREYPDYENNGPGDDDDPIRLITLGYYAEQGGDSYLVFDTRKNAEVDGQWTVHIDDGTIYPLPHWKEACESIYEGKSVPVVRHDGRTVELTDNDSEESIQSHFGDMLVDVVTELRDDEALRQLPLHAKAFMVVEEFDGRYFWPPYRKRKSMGRIIK